MSAQFLQNHSLTAIVLTTYYPKWYKGSLKSIKHTDKVRGDLCMEFLTVALKSNYNVVLVDGKSSKSFRKELQGFQGLHIINRKIMKRSPNKRVGIKAAAKIQGVQTIVLTEPEKVNLLQFMPVLTEPILKGEVDIVAPKREEKAFKSSYPRYMYESETEGMRIYNEALYAHGLLTPDIVDMDNFFGPRVFRNEKKILDLFMKKYTLKTSEYTMESKLFDADEYSNVQAFPIVQALKKKIKIKSVEIPFTYSRLQKENEEATAKEAFYEKRKSQKLSILIDLFHFLSFLDKNKKSGLREVKS